MNLPDKRPEVGALGLVEDRRAFNRLIDYVKSLTPKDSPTVHPNWTSAGVSYSSEASGKTTTEEPSNPYVVLMTITAVNSDTLTCTRFVTGTAYTVWKPYKLRGGALCHPTYAVGDRIVALFGADGADPIDANVDGRSPAFQVRLCVNTGTDQVPNWQTQNMLVNGGPA